MAFRLSRLSLAAIAFAALILLLRLAIGREVHFCGTPDSCFYLATARTLATEHRFHAHFLFDLQLAHPTVPNTGLEYWRPGTSFLLLLAAPFSGGRVSLYGSLAVSILAGLLLALAARHAAALAARSSRDPSLARLLPAGAFALCLVWPPLWDGSLTPDSSLFYGAAVAWFLALFTVRRQGPLQDAIALVAAGIAYLIRNDAILLLVPFAAVLWRRHQLHRRNPDARQNTGGSPSAIATTFAGFGLALVPMHLLYLAVLGTAFPPGTAQTLFLWDLGDFVRYRSPVSAHSLLAHGVTHLLTQRASTAFLILYRVLALMLGYPALILLAGLFTVRTNANDDTPSFELTGPAAFAVTLFLVYSLVLPAIGVFSALRSAVGLLPFAAILTVWSIHSLARTPRIAAGLLAAVLTAYTVSGIMDDRRNIGPMNDLQARDTELAQALRGIGADPGSAVIMTPDPVQFSVTTGFAAIAEPNNGLDAIAQECRDLGATHVMLDTEHLPASPEEIDRALAPAHIQRLDGQHALILELAGPH